MLIQVNTAPDAKGKLAPARIVLDGRNIDVADVMEQWSGVGDRYFKVKDAAENVYLLHFDESRAAWELVMFMSRRGATIPDLIATRMSRFSRPAVDGKL